MAFVAGHSFRAEATFFQQLVPLLEHRVTGFGDGFGLGVVKPDLAAGLGRDLGDAPAHGPCADDGDFGKCERHF